MQTPIIIQTEVHSTKRTETEVIVTAIETDLQGDETHTWVTFKDAGHKARAAAYAATVTRTYDSAVQCVRALAAAELVGGRMSSIGLQFADTILSMGEET